MNGITPKQKLVLQAIQSYFAHYGKMPSIRELRNELVHHGLNVKSSRSVFNYLAVLEDKGLIKRDSRSRGMELTNSTDTYFIDVPILGMANAGSPTLIAEENIEGYLKISKRLYNSQRVFAIRISGDSMNQSRINGKSIEDGDYVIVNQEGQNYKNNDRVLVVLDGLATVKTYRQVEDHIIGLFPESNNQTHRPIYLTPADDFIINGKIIDVLKNVEI